MGSNDDNRARSYTDASRTSPVKIVSGIVAVFFLLGCAGTVGYFLGQYAKETETNNETPIPSSSEDPNLLQPKPLTTSMSGTIQPSTELTSTAPSFDTSTDHIVTTEEYIEPIEKYANCSSVCSQIVKGNITNHPVGFATTGSAATIFPGFATDEGIEVYCDCTNGSGGAWTVFQRRMDGSVDFYQKWNKYAEGFGNKSGEFWLGLDTISNFTSGGEYELRIDLENWENNTAYAEYSIFSVADASTNYILTVGGYIGTAGDMLIGRHNGKPFSTRGEDNDDASFSCAKYCRGAWWFTSCYTSHLNGEYFQGGVKPSGKPGGIDWGGTWKYLKSTEMKLRKK